MCLKKITLSKLAVGCRLPTIKKKPVLETSALLRGKLVHQVVLLKGDLFWGSLGMASFLIVTSGIVQGYIYCFDITEQVESSFVPFEVEKPATQYTYRPREIFLFPENPPPSFTPPKFMRYDSHMQLFNDVQANYDAVLKDPSLRRPR